MEDRALHGHTGMGNIHDKATQATGLARGLALAGALALAGTLSWLWLWGVVSDWGVVSGLEINSPGIPATLQACPRHTLNPTGECTHTEDHGDPTEPKW